MTIEKRAEQMVKAMSLKEKVSQMVHEARGISRLNIPSYNWWNECLHGVGRAGIATVYPQAIALAAMFDDQFMEEIASSISDEVRAKYNESVKCEFRGVKSLAKILPNGIKGRIEAHSLWYRGLTCWSPNINIFRDPRWGRGHETYGEDPWLTSRLGVAFVHGLQGNDPKYLKTIATPKHYAVHSGPEALRHKFDAEVGLKDLYETYLPAFKACVQEADAGSIMSAYNSVNGEPSSASETLLENILRKEWGFKGFVVSDCGAIRDIRTHHKKTKSFSAAAAMAVNAGCDLNCGFIYNFLKSALRRGLVSEKTLDKSLQRLFEARVRLGMFDPPQEVPYSTIGSEKIDSPEHREQAVEASRRSLVLLKNDSILPLNQSIRKIAVIGPNADSKQVLLANYNGTPSSWTTALEGIRKRFEGDVLYKKGCHISNIKQGDIAEAKDIAREADAIILCLGLSPELEGEEGDAYNADAAGDKMSLKLPGLQEDLLEAVKEAGKPIITVIFAGSATDLRKVHKHSSAVIQAWYPGQDGGQAVAELICGDFSPSGRLPVTFVQSDADLPPFEDYSMKGRSYRYLETAPLYPFGYGLSYNKFTYSDLKVEKGEDGTVDLSVTVTNSGEDQADEIVQFYLNHKEAGIRVPNYQLCSFKRVSLKPGESRQVIGIIRYDQLCIVNEEGKHIPSPGSISFYAGGQQPDSRSEELTGKSVLREEIK
jgi:beta-glucosidase